jgi:hypothetical protein
VGEGLGFVKAFLFFTVTSYFVAAATPKRAVKNVKSKWMERVMFAVFGLLLLAALIVDFWGLWLACSVVWTVAAGQSYLGYVQWNVLWKDEVSDAAQMVMFCWDALIAVCCLLMAGV